MDLRNAINKLFVHGRLSVFLGMALLVLWVGAMGMSGRPSVEEGGKIQVIASIPDLADLTARIGGDLVMVESLAKGMEDPHGVPIKPSFLPKLNRADILVIMGLAHEHAWLTALVQTARNPNILRGNPGLIDCSTYITPKQIPATLSRREGDLHPQGNPHYNLDPANTIPMAKAIAEGLGRAYPAGQPIFKKNLKTFEQHMTAQINTWLEASRSLRGVKFVSFHQDTIYFAERFGMVESGHIETRPGIAPTQGHLTTLINTMKTEQIRLILREPHFSERIPNWVAEHTGAKVAKFLIMVGGHPGVTTYEELINFNLQSIQQALTSLQREGS